MRDPWLGRGPDGVWHMLWTWGLPRKGFPCLKRSPGPAMPGLRKRFGMETAIEWVIFQAATIPGRFAATDHDGDNGYHHRICATRTKDWKTFTKSELFFDPGYSVIDSTMVYDPDHADAPWIMIFKHERKTPLQKRLRLEFAKSTKKRRSVVDGQRHGTVVQIPAAVAATFLTLESPER